MEFSVQFKIRSTLHRFQTKTILFCSGYGYRPCYNAVNDQRKRIVSKTLSRVERFENGTVWFFLVWTAKTILSENDDVTTTTTPGCKPLNREYLKIEDRRFLVVSFLIVVIFSLLALMKAHLTVLRLFYFSRREQDIIKLLSLPALSGTMITKTTRSKSAKT